MGDELIGRQDRNELATDDELPVVARLVVEIRSDGTRTVARGALEDTVSGQRVAVAARGTTPLGLATALARSMFSVPTLAKRGLRTVLESKLLGRWTKPPR